MVGIVDYGMGNLLSVYHALDNLGAEARICSRPEELEETERLILPGVGAFRDCIGNLRSRGFVAALETQVLDRRKPILGICLGLQLMARRSFENGEFEGLGWFDADVVRLAPSDTSLRIPHIGWNQVCARLDSPLFAGIAENTDFYFVHSYSMRCNESADVAATVEYGGPFTAAIHKDNILATQFHPEKSQAAGLRLLSNFLQWCPARTTCSSAA